MPFSAIKGSWCKSAKGALHLAVPKLYISTKGGAPYRGEGGLHGANHNEVEGNNVTISKDEKFSF